MKAAVSIPLQMLRAAIDEWSDSLKKYVNAKGGHFE